MNSTNMVDNEPELGGIFDTYDRPSGVEDHTSPSNGNQSMSFPPEAAEFTSVEGRVENCPAEKEDASSHPRQMKTWAWLLLSPSLFFANLLINLDSTVVADLQPQILEALGEISKFPWINQTYSLGVAAASLMW